MTNKVKLLTAFFVLSFAMMIGVLPFSICGAGVLKVSAEETSTGDFSVTGGTYGTDYSYDDDNGVLTISGDKEYTISMATGKSSTSNTIKVTSTNGAKITLSGVEITSSVNVPMEITEAVKGTVTIVMDGYNYFTMSGGVNAGLLISTDSEVIITNEENKLIEDDIGEPVDMLGVSFSIKDTLAEQTVGIGSFTNDVNVTVMGGAIVMYYNPNNMYTSYGVTYEFAGIGSDEGDANINISEGSVFVSSTVGSTEDNGKIELVGIGSDEGNADINISGGRVVVRVTDSISSSNQTTIEVTGIGSDEKEANINISGGTVSVNASSNYEVTGIGTDEGNANINISGGTITASVSGDTDKKYAVYTGEDGSYSAYIVPDTTALDVEYKYSTTSSSSSTSQYMLYVEKTDISDITGGNIYFYCNVDDTIYQISDYISVESNSSNNGYNVIVSVFGGDGDEYGEVNARYLEEVMVLAFNTANGDMSQHQLTDYKEYDDGLGSNAAIGFPVDITIDDNTIIFALAKTHDYMDADGENVIYYLSKTSSASGGVDVA